MNYKLLLWVSYFENKPTPVIYKDREEIKISDWKLLKLCVQVSLKTGICCAILEYEWLLWWALLRQKLKNGKRHTEYKFRSETKKKFNII